MAIDVRAILNRDHHTCQFRLRGCIRTATEVELRLPKFLGGERTPSNAAAACDYCSRELHRHRRIAAEVVANWRHHPSQWP